MEFVAPVDFVEAVQNVAVRRILPTSMSSKELQQLHRDIKQTSIFSARTSLESYLQKIKEVVQRIVQPVTVLRDGRPVTEGMDQATARLALKDALDAIGYEPDPKIAGTIQDLSSDQRLNLIIETNVDIARGYGQYRQGMDPDVLDQWPAWELFRLEERDKERDWSFRWRLAGDASGSPIGKGWTMTPDGKLIALKTHKIWDLLGSSDLFEDGLSNPYPPFAFNSGMSTREVDREDAVKLGLIGELERLTPVPDRFGKGVAK